MYKRKNMSDWVIHFVHDRNPNDDMYVMRDIASLEEEGELRIPSYFDNEGNPIDLTWKYYDDEWPIKDDAKAFSVLQKIIHDGYIRSGWSLRNMKPTIYGPYSAVCFTEMPLYALLEYAKDRGCLSGYERSYGIAFLRSELFDVGARQVIYGLSTTHQEANNVIDPNYARGLRNLSASCGIGLQEQYRYVYTNLTKSKDWTHEREWRWPFRDGVEGIMGMPFLLSDYYGYQFSQVVVIVNDDEEQQIIMDQLKNMYDSKSRDCGIDYNVSLLPAVKVLSLETLERFEIDMNEVRIEDVPYLQAQIRKQLPVSREVLNKVKQAINGANDIFNAAIREYRSNLPEYHTREFDWGAVHVFTEGNTEVTQALFDLDIASTYADGKYIFHVGERVCNDMTMEKIGAEAAAKYLTEQLGQPFYIYLMPD